MYISASAPPSDTRRISDFYRPFGFKTVILLSEFYMPRSRSLRPFPEFSDLVEYFHGRFNLSVFFTLAAPSLTPSQRPAFSTDIQNIFIYFIYRKPLFLLSLPGRRYVLSRPRSLPADMYRGTLLFLLCFLNIFCRRLFRPQDAPSCVHLPALQALFTVIRPILLYHSQVYLISACLMLFLLTVYCISHSISIPL